MSKYNESEASGDLYYYNKYDKKYGNWTAEQYSYIAPENYKTTNDKFWGTNIEPVWDDISNKYISPEYSYSYRDIMGWMVHNTDTLGVKDYLIHSGSTTNPDNSTFTHWTVHRYERNRTKTKGELIQTIQAVNGAYPNNGWHTDGYWYVRIGPVNTNPTLTSSILGGVVSSVNSYFSKVNLV